MALLLAALLIQSPVTDTQVAPSLEALVRYGVLVVDARIMQGCIATGRKLTILFDVDGVKIIEGSRELARVVGGKLSSTDPKSPLPGSATSHWTLSYLSKPEGLAHLINCMLAKHAPFSSASAGSSGWPADRSSTVFVHEDTVGGTANAVKREQRAFVARLVKANRIVDKWRMISVEMLGKPPKFWRLGYTEIHGNGGGFAGGSSLEWTASASMKRVSLPQGAGG